MEKRVVLAIALTLGVWFVWITWFAPQPPLRPPGPAAPAQGTVPAGAPRPSAPAGGRKPSTQYAATPDVVVRNDSLDLTFASKGAALKAAEAWSCVKHEHGDRSVAGDPGQATAWIDGMAGALSTDLLGDEATPDLALSDWKVASGPDGGGGDGAFVAEFETDGLAIVKTVRPSADPANPWHADVDVVVRNVSAKPGSTRTLEVVGPVLPKSGAGGDPDAGLVLASAGPDGDTEFEYAVDVHKLLAEKPTLEKQSPTGTWAWIATRADFHLGALVPTTELPRDTRVGFRVGFRHDAAGAPPVPTAAPTFRIPLVVPPQGQETKFSFLFFAGPNSRTLLIDEGRPYHVLAPANVSTGFLGLKLTWVRNLLAWLLGVLASTGMGYGLAVISLTIIVRAAMFPVSRKSQISMRVHSQKMSRLKPKMDAIKEKYKDPRKQQEATMKLMREEKVGLLPGGCLLAFVQMPIWIALYNVLQTTFEMRHAGFLWVADLTSPDHLAHLPFFEGVWLMPEWLNLLPILMMITWYWSAAMQPLPTDPQQAQTAKMMRWMPVLMGFFLYSYPAGLALYMTASAVWTIGEIWIIRKLWLDKLDL
jgi:YidC/Oxa1 family membrane protein insertase